MSPFRTGVVTTTERREFATPVFLFGFEGYIDKLNYIMNSETAMLSKIPEVREILSQNGIPVGKYSFTALTSDGGATYEYWVYVPLKFSHLFTSGIKDQLSLAGISTKISSF
jgi:hypothetical protein